MTGSANCDIVSKGRRDLCGVKCIGVFPMQADEGSHRLEFNRPALLPRGSQDKLRRPAAGGTPQNDRKKINRANEKPGNTHC